MVMYAYGNSVSVDAMPDPGKVVVYGKTAATGTGWGAPAMFHYAPEGANPHEIAAHHGYDLMFVNMADDLPDGDPLLVAYENGAEPEPLAQKWFPKRHPGWKLCGMNDTEDGIVAIYLRKREEGQGNG